MANNFSKLMTETKLQIQEAQRTPSIRINTPSKTPKNKNRTIHKQNYI